MTLIRLKCFICLENIKFLVFKALKSSLLCVQCSLSNVTFLFFTSQTKVINHDEAINKSLISFGVKPRVKIKKCISFSRNISASHGVSLHDHICLQDNLRAINVRVMIFENTQNAFAMISISWKINVSREDFLSFRLLGNGKLWTRHQINTLGFIALKNVEIKTRREIQYEFMGIHWLFDEQESTPYHRENDRCIL